jgi:uncharacterized protein YjbI with pentapeptide repeats
MKTKQRIPLLSEICIVASASIVVFYWFRWGWPDFKNVWTWILLLATPFVLAFLALWFNVINRRNDLNIAADRLRETALQAFFDSVSELLLEKDLRSSQPGDEIRTLARARTVTLLTQLDRKRKLRVVEFLCESQLIAVVDLYGADLQGVSLAHASLGGANLIGANLSKADLSEANLSGADLSKANLSEAHLNKTDLSKARLHGARLMKADLKGAYMSTADLGYASLIGANLSETNLSGANLSKADLSYAILRGANLIVADLSRANLTEADLSGARLSGANLNGTNLDGADLSGANLNSTYLSLEQLTKAKGIQEYQVDIEGPQS